MSRAKYSLIVGAMLLDMMLIWQIDADTNVDVAAFNLEKAKENLVQLEPYTEQVMVFLLHSERRIDNAIYEARNILCQTEKEFVKSASEYFSEKNERIRMGKLAYGQGRYESAISLLRNADRSKDADAQFMVGQMYAKGRGVARDPSLAQKWFWKAANHGHAGAALEVEKALRKEERELRRSEDKIVAEIEEFTKQRIETKGEYHEGVLLFRDYDNNFAFLRWLRKQSRCGWSGYLWYLNGDWQWTVRVVMSFNEKCCQIPCETFPSSL